MNRKQFIQQCGFSCLGIMSSAALVESCNTTKHQTMYINEQNEMEVPMSAFLILNKKDRQETYRRYVVVSNDRLNYPLVVYRNTSDDYTALLLRCSHQYNELNVNGELLTCPAHGSEFDTTGAALQGPAENSLRKFHVTKRSNKLHIHLV